MLPRACLSRVTHGSAYCLHLQAWESLGPKEADVQPDSGNIHKCRYMQYCDYTQINGNALDVSLHTDKHLACIISHISSHNTLIVQWYILQIHFRYLVEFLGFSVITELNFACAWGPNIGAKHNYQSYICKIPLRISLFPVTRPTLTTWVRD